jgi:hypothetical protein
MQPLMEQPAPPPAEHRRIDVREDLRFAGPPRPWHVRVIGDVSPAFFKDPSFDPLASDDVVTFGGGTLEGEWVFAERVPLMIDVGYAGAGSTEMTFDHLTLTYALHSLQVGVLVGYRFRDAVMPYVRGGVALTWMGVTIEGNDDSFEDWVFAAGGYAMAGVELSLARRWMRRVFRSEVFTAGVRVEAGYLYLGSFDFPTTTDDDTLVEHTSPSLGAVRLDGASMRISVVLAF